MSSTGKKDKNQHIQVFVRVRPLNKQEGSANCMELRSGKELIIKHHSLTRTYNFDKIFGPDSKQLDVYKLVAEPTVREVIAGYNCTVLAYGQTGTGKTYTMAGGTVTDMNNSQSTSGWFEDVHSGIIPRTLSHMFDELRVQQVEYTVRVSYLELYNEEIFDLLSPPEDNTKLKLYDDNLKKGSVIVSGLTETTVNTKSEVFRILEKGAEKRKIAATLMNAQSSRSHTVFCIIVHTKENSIDGEDLLKTGKLYLVDLAGSENIKQSGATDVRARETFSINQSLLTLGRCISKLIERSVHIPYRESKLTRLLQDSLGGRTKTTLVATVSPAACHADESINTLEYAFRAKNITNKPEINQRLSKKTLMKEYTEEIDRLRKDLLANRMGKGIYLDEENYETFMRQREVHKEEITEKINHIRVMEEEMAQKKQLCAQLQISLEQHQKEVESKVGTIHTLESKLEGAVKQIDQLQEETEINKFIVTKYSETEEKLKSTAKELITVADTTTKDSRKLHDKLDTLTDISKQNKQLVEQHIASFSSKMNTLGDDIKSTFDGVYTCTEYCGITTAKLVELNSEAKRADLLLCCEVAHQEDLANELVTKMKNDLKEKRVGAIQGFNKATDCADEEARILRAKFNENVEELALDIYKLNRVRDAEHQEYQLGIQTLADRQNDTTIINLLTAFERIQLSREAERAQIIDELNNVEKLKSQLQEEEDEHNLFKQQTEAKMQLILDTVKCSMENMNDFVQKSNEKRTKHKEELDKLNKVLEDRKTEYSKAEDETQIFIKECVEEFRAWRRTFDSYIDSYKNIQAEQEKQMTLYEQCLDKGCESHLLYTDVTLKSVGTTVYEVFDELKELDDTYSTGHMDAVKLLSQWLCDLRAKIDSQTTSRAATNNDLLDGIRSANAGLASLCSIMEPSISTQIDSTQESIRKFCTSNMKEYKVTGETPQRKFHRYSRTLVETKPKEKLVEEFYSARLAGEITEETENESDTERDTEIGIEKENESSTENVETSDCIENQQPSRIPMKINSEPEPAEDESQTIRQNLKDRIEDNK